MPTLHNESVLVINSGSSSVKFTLFGIEDEVILARGVVERIGLEGTRISCTARDGKELIRSAAVKDTREAVVTIVDCLVDEK
ncbi:MAG: acetate kinase, partial [Deltaproteobacteria bacterium]